MIPLISLDLHDHHIARLRRAVDLPEPAFIAIFLTEVAGVIVLLSGIIHLLVMQLDPIHLPEIVHLFSLFPKA